MKMWLFPIGFSVGLLMQWITQPWTALFLGLVWGIAICICQELSDEGRG